MRTLPTPDLIRSLFEKEKQEIPDDLSPKEKSVKLAEMAKNVVEINSLIQRLGIRNSLNTVTLTTKKNKLMQDFMNTVKTKENVQAECKNKLQKIEALKKNTSQTLEQERKKKDLYKEKFDEIVENITNEYQVDPKEYEETDKKNKELREKLDEIPKTINKMEGDYKARIEELRTQFTSQDETVKKKMDDLREGASKVDEIKKETEQLKSKILPMKMKIPMANKKNGEYIKMFENTEQSISRYYDENVKVYIILILRLQGKLNP